uniref:Uncharacterized protein n=1 Tax=Rousettus aegyptiacus TaxID=9407 RepID=A0A7J8C2T4_ROUAE|nr:hypothetical protein HJG63_009450 [Rousettus aegyptiacus]
MSSIRPAGPAHIPVHGAAPTASPTRQKEAGEGSWDSVHVPGLGIRAPPVADSPGAASVLQGPLRFLCTAGIWGPKFSSVSQHRQRSRNEPGSPRGVSVGARSQLERRHFSPSHSEIPVEDGMLLSAKTDLRNPTVLRKDEKVRREFRLTPASRVASPVPSRDHLPLTEESPVLGGEVTPPK